MERFIGVEQARGNLGRLAEEVAGGEPVFLTKRGQVLAVLVSREEYSRMKEASTRLSRLELQERLGQIRAAVKKAGLKPSVVDEAIAAAREAL